MGVRQEQKEQRRQEILYAALDLFVTKGYAETRITDIAEKVSMSNGLLFHYFESKEKLYEEQPYVAKMFVLMADAQRSEGTPETVREIALRVNTIEQFVPIIEWGQKEGSIRDMACDMYGICAEKQRRNEDNYEKSGNYRWWDCRNDGRNLSAKSRL